MPTGQSHEGVVSIKSSSLHIPRFMSSWRKQTTDPWPLHLSLSCPSVTLLNRRNLDMMCFYLTSGPDTQITFRTPTLNIQPWFAPFFTWRVKQNKILWSQVNIGSLPFFSFAHPSLQLAKSCPKSSGWQERHCLDKFLALSLSLTHCVQVCSNILKLCLKCHIKPNHLLLFPPPLPLSYLLQSQPNSQLFLCSSFDSW